MEATKMNHRSSHQRCSIKKALLENLQNSLLNTCARVSFLENCIKKETLPQVFSCEFCKISKNTFFTKYIWATASVTRKFVLMSSATVKTECVCFHEILEAKAFNLKGKTRLYWNIADLEFTEAVVR